MPHVGIRGDGRELRRSTARQLVDASQKAKATWNRAQPSSHERVIMPMFVRL